LEDLLNNAANIGEYLMTELKKFPELKNVRGTGLMIGFDVPEEYKDLKKNILWNQKIFTGEAKPSVMRLLPSLALRKQDADQFLEALQEELSLISTTKNINP
jgi:acetylornithine aminotransferase